MVKKEEYYKITLLKQMSPEFRCRETPMECTYLGKIRDGILTVYYLKGNKKEERHYANGEKNGHHRTFYPDGTLKSDFCYEDDRVEDWAYTYHADGKKNPKCFSKKER